MSNDDIRDLVDECYAEMTHMETDFALRMQNLDMILGALLIKSELPDQYTPHDAHPVDDGDRL